MPLKCGEVRQLTMPSSFPEPIKEPLVPSISDVTSPEHISWHIVKSIKLVLDVPYECEQEVASSPNVNTEAKLYGYHRYITQSTAYQTHWNLWLCAVDEMIIRA